MRSTINPLTRTAPVAIKPPTGWLFTFYQILKIGIFTVMTDLDRQLQALALTDWNKFSELIKLDTRKLDICLRRKRGKSVRQIAQALKMAKSSVGEICKICPQLPDVIS